MDKQDTPDELKMPASYRYKKESPYEKLVRMKEEIGWEDDSPSQMDFLFTIIDALKDINKRLERVEFPAEWGGI